MYSQLGELSTPELSLGKQIATQKQFSAFGTASYTRPRLSLNGSEVKDLYVLHSSKSTSIG